MSGGLKDVDIAEYRRCMVTNVFQRTEKNGINVSEGHELMNNLALPEYAHIVVTEKAIAKINVAI